MKKSIVDLGKVSVMALAEPIIVSGTKKLASDALSWIIGISSVAGVAWLGWHIFLWYTAGDNDKPAEAKKCKHIVIGIVAVVLVEVIVKLVLSYYTVPTA